MSEVPGCGLCGRTDGTNPDCVACDSYNCGIIVANAHVAELKGAAGALVTFIMDEATYPHPYGGKFRVLACDLRFALSQFASTAKTSETKTPIEQVGDNAGEILGSRVGSSRPLSPGGGSEEPGSSSDANQNFYLALALGYNELAKHATREGDKVYWRLMRTEAVKKLSYDPFAISEKP